MSYSISISGHLEDPDDVREAFEELVRSLRVHDSADSYSAPVGSLSYQLGSVGAADVADVSLAADAEDEGLDDPATEESTTNEPEPA